MKGLLSSLWQDPKVASGLLMMVASLIGLILTNPQGDLRTAIGQAILNLAGGGLLFHASPPGAASRTDASPPAPGAGDGR